MRFGFGHYPNPVWFEEGGCKPLSDHAYAAILNYLEEDENVEAYWRRAAVFRGKTRNIPPGGEMGLAWTPNSCLGSTYGVR